MCRKDKGGETVDRTEERILEYALDSITRELKTLDRAVGKSSECYNELYEFYIRVYDEYEKETEKNIIW